MADCAINAAVAIEVFLSNVVLSNVLGNGSRVMNKFSRVWLTLPLMAFAILPARAQVTVDVAKITCEQYVLFTVADPHDIAMWLSGYYNSRRNNTVVDTQQFREHGQKVMDYCRRNMKTTVMEAVETVLGISK
jgi:acid stress chaperone HdeB